MSAIFFFTASDHLVLVTVAVRLAKVAGEPFNLACERKSFIIEWSFII